MNPQRVLENFLHLVQIDSPSCHEHMVAQELLRQLTNLGCEAYIDDTAHLTGSDTGNVIARLEGSAPGVLVLSSHMDTVSPCCSIKPVVGEDEIIRSESDTILGADDKSGVAAIIEAVTSLIESGEPYPTLIITFTVQEEVGLCGAKVLDEELFKDNPITLVLDGEERPGGICIGAPFHYTFKARCIGKSAHAGVAPEKGVSAISIASSALSSFEYGRIDEETTANIGTISGGRAGNIVAPECLIEGECRSLNREKLEQVKVSIQKTFEDAAQKFGGEVEIDWDLEYHGYRLDEDDEVVTLLKEAAVDCGLDPHTSVSGGGSDANVLAGKGARSVVLGTGMTNFHTTTECIRVKDLEDSARFVEAIARRIARHG